MSRKVKEPTRAQLSSRLAYQSHIPAFLQKLQNKMAGNPDPEEEEDYDEEWEDDGSGRPPIPRRPRPAIPERPDDDPGSADEEGGDEKPQVVVLREGKHLTEREAENIRRKEKGLPPLPEDNEDGVDDDKPSNTTSTTKKKEPAPSLSFSSAKSGSNKSFKRKVLGGGDSEDEKDNKSKKDKEKKEPAKKKAKKAVQDPAFLRR